MKKLLTLCLIVASLSCNTNRQATGGSQIGLQNLTHYYLKNSVELNSSYNGIIVSDADSFNDLFYAETMNNQKTATPDFEGQIVIALALNTSDNSKLVFTKAEVNNHHINVYGKMEMIKEEAESPVAVATLPKWSDARKINFYIDNNLVKTVSVSFKNSHNIFADAKAKGQSTTNQKQVRRPAVI